MKAKKKPVIIDYFPIIIGDNVSQLYDWVKSLGDKVEDNFVESPYSKDTSILSLKVKTLEGISYDISSDDVIIRGVKGEYYPCKKEIFESTYDKLED
jgi:hypothetical protein